MTTFDGLNSNINSVQPFQGDSLLLISKSLRVWGTLLIDLAMKPWNHPVVLNQQNLIYLFHYFFILTKWWIKDLKYKPNMINKTNLHPIRASNYSNSVLSCNIIAYWSGLHLPTKIVSIQNWNPSVVKFFNYPSLVLEFSILTPHRRKIL